MRLQRVAFLLLLGLALPLLPVQWRTRIDLRQVLNNPVLLRSLTILYVNPQKPGQMFYIRGDGTLTLQQLPVQANVWNSLAPTCRARVSPGPVTELLETFIARRFFDLPLKSFTFLDVSDDPHKELRIHTIIVEAGGERASRSFATGTYAGKTETIPPDFAAIETAVRSIQDDVFPPLSKDCSLAPPIKF